MNTWLTFKADAPFYPIQGHMSYRHFMTQHIYLWIEFVQSVPQKDWKDWFVMVAPVEWSRVSLKFPS